MKKLFIIFLNVFPLQICVAQLMTNNDIPVTITSGTTITVNGGITNSGITSINNNGTITLTGDFINNTNNNLFGTSVGTVTLNGSSQNIGGTTSTTFNNLFLTGTGNKTLLTDAITGGAYSSPAGVLQLNDRIFLLNSKLLTINNNSAGAITRTTGFIQSESDPVAGYGKIRWLIRNALSGTNYIFPFGISSGNIFIPFQMQITTPGTGLTGSFTVSTYPTSSNNLPLPTGVTSVIDFSGNNNADKVLDRFWIIEPLDYFSLPVSNLTFTYRDIEHAQPTNSITENNIQMQFNNGSIWSPTPSGLVNTTANTVFVNNVGNYSFAWTGVDNSSPLPIELLSFNAQAINNTQVECRWVTASEINNDYFNIERSKDGIELETIGLVEGAGNSNSILHYSFTDINPFNGLSYYRLKQTDFDGKFTYTEWFPVHLNLFSEISIFPNPADDYLYLYSINQSDELKIEMYNSLGQKIFQDTWYGRKESFFTIRTSGIVSGIYNLIIESAETKNNYKILIQR